MPKKKTTTKKKPEQAKVHVPFDLNVETKEQANELVAHLSQLQMVSGWLLLKQIMEGNIATLERCIIIKQDIDGKPLTDDEADEYRRKRNVMEEMINKPQELIDTFQRKVNAPLPSYDPYANDMGQFRRDSTDEFASSLRE